jgi:hypothetical protein
MAVFFLFRLAFGYRACQKSCLDNSVNHLFDGHLAGIVSDNGLLFGKTHFCLLDSLEPLQGRPHRYGAGPSGHSLDPENCSGRRFGLAGVNWGHIRGD